MDRAAADLAALGIAGEPYLCDITDRAAVERLAHQASSRGPVVAVVHTAGISPQMGPAETIIRVNAIGTINVTEALLAIAAEGFRLAYSMSKHFVVWYSKRVAPQFGARGGRVVSVSPGSFDTAMGRLEEQSGAGAMLRFASLKRFGRVEEIAEVLAFCASEKPGYLTGTDILCDGGVVAGISRKDLLALARSST